MAKYALVIYPKGFHEIWTTGEDLKPEVILIHDVDNVFDAGDFACVYTMARFKHPGEFDGCHIVSLS